MMTKSDKGTTESAPLPKSGGMMVEKDGVDDAGYIRKKGTASGNDARFNMLPPGMNIEDQETAEINPQKIMQYAGGLSYPGDGGFPGKARDG